MLKILLTIFYLGQIAGSTPSTTTPSEVIGLESPIISEEYKLFPGDGLLVTITGKSNYSYHATVTYEGKITINLPVGSTISEQGLVIPRYDVVNTVKVSGLTLKSAQETLSNVFNNYLKSVSVKLTLLSMRQGAVFVSGEVQSPGVYYVSPVERVSQVINKAGGITPIGSKANIKLVRQGSENQTVDLDRFERTGDLANNPFIETGDIIIVPKVQGIVTVKGAVFGRGETKLRHSVLTTEKERISEGVYELKPNDRISDMIIKAGGITPWADLTAGYIERLDTNGKHRMKIPIDLYKIIFEQDSTKDLIMRNGDILVIPPLNTLVYVQGEVNRPGSFLFSPNLKSSDYIGQAAGPTNYANIRGAYLRRGQKKISLKKDPLVEPGDIIFVPRTTFKWWQDYVTIISAIAIPIATALLYLRVSP
ncbi:MAG: SLBB domain-containing protein [candidate division WOR-3 bacterium]|nr:SLBB domain-containing protein [candidate division WOR-3 bacterium]